MSAEDCRAAETGGAARIELVSAIELGGLTPSLGAFKAAKAVCKLPLMVMLRPRTGGFGYSEGEFAAMLEDARRFADEGAAGIVTGILTRDARVDVQRCRALTKSVSRPIEWVFHRAFDVTPNPFEAMECLIELGFKRVLTSGQRPTAQEGSELIRQLVEAARGRIEILPGSGIGLGNIREVREMTGASQLHVSAWHESPDPSTSETRIRFNGRTALESGFRTTSAETVQALVQAAQ